MKVVCCLILLAVAFNTQAQTEISLSSASSNDRLTSDMLSTRYSLKVHQYRLSTLQLMQSAPAPSERASANYWTNAITTQSYGKGKVGTFYYWDVQGNLREMRGFIDIAGKNKRGLKLVFPWR